MKQQSTPEAFKLFLEGSLALAQVEHAGLKIDTEYLNKTISKTNQRIQRLQEKLRNDEIYTVWRKAYGERAVLTSPEQLGHVFFNVLKYPNKGETSGGNQKKKKRLKSDKSAFDGINHPFLKPYFRMKGLQKLHDTYLLGLRKEIVNGFVHPSFNLHTVSSYRSSCSQPNVQNLIARDAEFIEMLRRAFIPRAKDWLLIEIDYSAIEVRINAAINRDPVLIEYIKNPKKDMHRDQAMQCYMLKQEQVSKQSRYCAKNMFVFPQFYGDYYIDCAIHLWQAISNLGLKLEGTEIGLKEHLASKGIKGLGVCDPKQRSRPGTFEQHIKAVEESFWKTFHVYADWKHTWYEEYRKNAGFFLPTGFWVSGLMKRNEVINLAAQGAAFHCLLWSLIRLQKWLNKHKMKAKIINEIHDSMLIDCPKNEAKDVIAKAKQIMTEDLVKAWEWICVPIAVEVEVSETNWFDKKPYLEAA